MLEILLIIAVSKKISTMMTAKGRNPTGWVLLFIGLWIGGEILGMIIGAILTLLVDPRAMDGDGFMCGAYIFAIIGAAIGGTSGYLIAKSMSDLSPPKYDDYDDDDDEYGEDGRARRRRRRAMEEDDDDRDDKKYREGRRRSRERDEGIEEDR